MTNSRVAVFALLTCMLFALTVMTVPDDASAQDSHDPIYISGNWDFSGANGVRGGSGTPSDPYIIENWKINASSGHGIDIRNTDAHFIIRHVDIHSGGWNHEGMLLDGVTNGRLENNTMTDVGNGVKLDDSSNITVAHNAVSFSLGGLFLWSSTNNTIIGNNMSGNIAGITLASDGNTFINNTLLENERGIYCGGALDNVIEDNTISENHDVGMIFEHCYGNTILHNEVLSNNESGIVLMASGSNTVASNVVAEHELSGITSEHSYNNTISGNSVTDNGEYGILLESSPFNTVTENIVSGSEKGIHIHSSRNATLSGNRVEAHQFGISLQWSNGTSILSNTVSDSWRGVSILFSNEANVSGNNLSSNGNGIRVYNSDRNRIADNILSTNHDYGIDLESSDLNHIIGNTVDGSDVGTHLRFSDFNTVASNLVSGNRHGIVLWSSDYNRVVDNDINSNEDTGLHIHESTNNRIYHNDFSDNAVLHAYDNSSMNAWHDGYPSGGNYWSDHECSDEYSGSDQDRSGSDGICDTPYDVEGGRASDLYPLARPPEALPTEEGIFAQAWFWVALMVIAVILISALVLERRGRRKQEGDEAP